MATSEGKRRVVIEAVEPQVNEGQYAIKRIVGESVEVTADIFADGHDKVSANILHKTAQESQWRRTPMRALVNDRWKGSFRVTREGYYFYCIEAWVDHWAVFVDALGKKHGAGQEVGVELLIGAELLEAAAKRAGAGPDSDLLSSYAQRMRRREDVDLAVELALGREVGLLVRRYPEHSSVARYYRELRVKVDRGKALFSSWYELFPRSLGKDGKSGTLKDCERMLGDIAAMGFDVLYLPPIHPIGRTNRKGRNNSVKAAPGDPGSPWAIGAAEGGHKSIHPELGTMEDFESLVASGRKHGVEIALDLAFQCSGDHPWIKEHPEWFRWRPDGTIQYAENPPKKYEDIVPLNFESERYMELWQELRDVVFFWIDRGVRIFRVDNPHTKPFAFWEWLIGEVYAEYPDVIFLAEAFTRPKIMKRLAKLGFTQSYTYFTWRNTRAELIEYMHELTRGKSREFLRPNFWPNTPDILSQYLQYGGKPAFIARLVLAATLSSNYGVYGPVYELCVADGVEGKEEYVDAEKYEIRQWDRRARGSIRDVITRLNRIRRENPALQETWNVEFYDCDNEMIICYGKKTAGAENVIVTAVNLDPYHRQGGWVRLPLEELGIDGSRPYMLHDLLGGDRYIWQGELNFIELEPKLAAAHVLRLHKRLRRETDFDYFL